MIQGSPVYSALLVIAIIISGLSFWRLRRQDTRLPWIYLWALLGGFLGAKVAYLLAEGWLDWGQSDQWLRWAAGKSIIGGLLGGYAGAELAKRDLNYQRPTGDIFASMVPLTMILGRGGCLHAGCCLGTQCETSRWWTLADQSGHPRWPAVPLEMIYLALMLVVFHTLRRAQAQSGQHFHLFLISYGLMRFMAEFYRETPKVLLGLSGYAWLSGAMILLGAVRFWQRRSQCNQRTPAERHCGPEGES
jgi:phosphatidylglycerol---prolipoprotein diacylglyceryl transferase